jgi:hypothetical protein
MKCPRCHADNPPGVNGICGGPGFCDNSAAESFLVRGADDVGLVPEPTTLFLFGSSLVTLGGTAWRRTRRT